jgi:hypothetical protein
MDISQVKIAQKDIDVVLARATPAQAASFVGDACTVYKQARPFIETAITILKIFYPPASTALAALVAILDKVCP